MDTTTFMGQDSAQEAALRVLHTSDWHLGQMLAKQKRYHEFEAFFEWLLDTLRAEAIDVLLVAGDIFDNTTPSNRAQALYYDFLRRVSTTPCRHVVIIAGNHDSPTFLEAPRQILALLDVHVIGTAGARLEDEIVTLRDRNGEVELIVGAVPYLRARDLQDLQPGENPDQHGQRVVEAVMQHHAAVGALVLEQRRLLATPVPAVLMGHLFTTGGQTTDGDGVRPLYVGNLAAVSPEVFAPELDYVALGHLHIPQRVGSGGAVHYSGSPLPMGLDEAGQEKRVCVVALQPGVPAQVRSVPVPVTQPILRIAGDLNDITVGLDRALRTHPGAWIDILYEGEPATDAEGVAVRRDGELTALIDQATAGRDVRVLRVRQPRLEAALWTQSQTAPSLAEMREEEVFRWVMTERGVGADAQEALLATFAQALQSMAEEDRRAE